MTRKNKHTGDAYGEPGRSGAAQEAQAQASLWKAYKNRALAQNPTACVDALHSRFKAMSASEKVGCGKLLLCVKFRVLNFPVALTHVTLHPTSLTPSSAGRVQRARRCKQRRPDPPKKARTQQEQRSQKLNLYSPQRTRDASQSRSTSPR